MDDIGEVEMEGIQLLEELASSSNSEDEDTSESEYEANTEFVIGDRYYDDEEDEEDDIWNDFPMSTLKICATTSLAPATSTDYTDGERDNVGSFTKFEKENLGNNQKNDDDVSLKALLELKQQALQEKEEVIREQENEIDALHTENMRLQRELREAKTCMRDLANEVDKFKSEMELGEVLRESNEDESKNNDAQTFPELKSSRQVDISKLDSSKKLNEVQMDFEPPAAKKSRKSVSFNLPVSPTNARRSERIFLSSASPVKIEDTREIENKTSHLPVPSTTTSQKIRRSKTNQKGEKEEGKEEVDKQILFTNFSLSGPTSLNTSNADADLLHRLDESRLAEGFFCICGQTAPSKSKLQNHLRYHTIERRFACTSCKRMYLNLRDLRRHMEAVHKIKCEKKNGCRDCGSCFPSKKELFYHLADVHNHGPLARSRSSPECNKSVPVKVEKDIESEQKVFIITRVDTLITDDIAAEALLSLKTTEAERNKVTFGETTVSRHTNPAPSQNKIEQQNKIVIELWNNEDEPSDVLEIKPDEQDYSDSKMNHGKMGMFGKNTWLCVCGTKFMTERSLIAHVHLKSGLNPFKCQVCSNTFPRFDYLKYHLRSSHGIISQHNYACGVCGIEVESMKKLRKHRENAHRGMFSSSTPIASTSTSQSAAGSRKRKSIF